MSYTSSPDFLSYLVDHDFAKGHFFGVATPAAGHLAALPTTLWACDSFELYLYLYENQKPVDSPTECDLQGAQGKLYIKFADTADSPTEVCASATITEAVPGSGNYNLVHFTVAKDAIPASYAGSSLCLLYAVIDRPDAPSGNQRTVAQRLYITDGNGTETANPPAQQMDYTPAVSADWDWTATDPDDVAEALDDLAEELTDVVVRGPATNTANAIPQWDGANSRLLKDGLSLVATVGATGADTSVPSEQAVREAFTVAGAVARWSNDDVDTGTETLDSVAAVAAGNAYRWDYRLKCGLTALRTGFVIAVVGEDVYGALTVAYKEYETTAMGAATDSDFAMSCDISSGALRLRGTAASDNWDARGLRTRIDF